MKPTTYALIAALTIGVAPTVAAIAQQDTDHPAARIVTRHHLNTAPVILAPVTVVVPAVARNVMAKQGAAPINNTPVRLAPVHIVASRNGIDAPVQAGKPAVTPQRPDGQVQIRVVVAELRIAQVAQ